MALAWAGSTGDSEGASKELFWQKIFSILGPFDLYGTGGNDPLLRSRRDLVVQIFRLIDYPDNLEISVAALHVIADMAESPVFASTTSHSPHKLYSILEAAGELPAVMEAFLRRLEREETEQVSLVLSDSSIKLFEKLQNDSSLISEYGLTNLIRLQILDFFIRNVSKSGFNISHYLLGFTPELLVGPATQIPTSQNGDFNCFHLLMELLSFGLGQPSTPIIALDHPSLGQKCYELLNVLLTNQFTCRAVVNYLRDNEDFYRKQLAFFTREPVDLIDIGFTIIEMNQKAALIRGAMLDLHLAFGEGAWTYARKLATVLVKGILGSTEQNPETPLDAGQSLISLQMSTVESVLTADYQTHLSANVQDQLILSVDSLVKSCTKIAQLILVALDRIPYDRSSVLSLQSLLITSLVPVLNRLLANQYSHPKVLESCSSLMIVMAGYFHRDELNNTSSALAGDELSSIAVGAIQCILRSDSSLASRGFLYSVFCDCMDLIARDSSSASQLTSLIRKEVNRLVEVATVDSIVPSADADGWKTMSTSFLRRLIVILSTDLLDDTSLGSLVLDRLSRLGYLKSLVGAIRTEDRLVISSLYPNNRNMNSFYLWRSRFTLLEKLSCLPRGGEKLVEAGLLEVIAGFRVLEGSRMLENNMEDSTRLIMENRLYLLLLPLIRLLATLGTDNIAIVRNGVINLVNNNLQLFESIIRGNNLHNLSSSSEYHEIVAVVSKLLMITGGSNPSACIPLLLRILQEENLQSNNVSKSIISSCIQSLAASMIKSGNLCVVSLYESGQKDHLSLDSMTEIFKIWMPQLPNKEALTVMEGALFILGASIENCLDSERNRSELALVCKQTIRLLSSLFEKIPGVTLQDLEIGKESIDHPKQLIELVKYVLRILNQKASP